MATHIHRFIIVVPVAQVPAWGQWWVNNIDLRDDMTGWVTLNPSGLWEEPPTYHASNGSFDDPNTKKIINKACQQTSVTPPTLAVWNGWTKAQRYAWLRSVQNALWAETGSWLDLGDNEGEWESAEGVVAGLGLKPRFDDTGGPA